MQGWESPEPKIVIWQWTKDCDLIGQRKIVILCALQKGSSFLWSLHVLWWQGNLRNQTSRTIYNKST